ncbi:Flagellar biosynthesis protein FlhA [hydrothermal vent metagenome]|uniref:Flagellar biosynthesis protein FlhA n=1 Tax=hydrothermal vent metagenome TaxID=652676 RepID=A0A3B0YD01_9ZZZZ
MAGVGALNSNQNSRNGAAAPILLVALLAMIIVPLPPILLDIFFSFNIALSLVVMLVAIYVLKPLDFGVFPSILLITTLLRLALNVASTRVVLLEGHTGSDAAGQVIQSFGEFVVGGNYAVGLVVFSILVIINFAVVTKGAGRIAEVSARFTLDSLPGKQMAIDADLNAGVITQEDAKERREEVRSESDFYGAMDGASKFVRGDAVAGILIMFINIVGGLAIGMAQHGLGFSDAMRIYTLLTIGDGLVAQIPSLVISTAAAILVTRVSSSQDMGEQVINQLFRNPQALYVTAGIIGFMGLIPGMPNIAFLTLAGVCGGAGRYFSQQAIQQQDTEVDQVDELPEPVVQDKELSWDDVSSIDIIGLEVGYRLIPLVDKAQGGDLMTKVKGVRKKLSQSLGFLIQAVHIRDNLDLAPNVYRISLFGVPVGEAELYPDQDLAINPGQVFGSLQGTVTKDPAFGLDAIWIDSSLRDQAQTLGYTVVDPSTVIATHLSQLLQANSHKLLGHEEVQKLFDMLSETAPKLVESLIPKLLPLGIVVKVLQGLLEDHIPIRDIRSIAESLADHAGKSTEPVYLTSAVRSSLGHSIVQMINGMNQELSVMTLDPSLEQLLQQTIMAGGDNGAVIEPGLAEQLQQSLAGNTQQLEASGQPAVILTAPLIRPWLARMTRHSIPGLNVLAYNEVPDDKQIRVVTVIGQQLTAD